MAERESVQEETLRAATRVSKTILTGMVRKKWVSREDVFKALDEARMTKVAVLKTVERKINSKPSGTSTRGCKSKSVRPLSPLNFQFSLSQ